MENIASIKIMYNNIIYAESASVRRSTLYIHNCEHFKIHYNKIFGNLEEDKYTIKCDFY